MLLPSQIDFLCNKPKEDFANRNAVYYIFNVATLEMYVGSTVNFPKRWKFHRRLLRSGKHHCSHLQHSWNKYGEENFRFFVACPTGTIKQAREIEQALLRNEKNKLFNETRFVSFREQASQPKSEEHKRKIALALRGKRKSAEHVERIRNVLTGRKCPPRTDETKERLSVANKGKSPWIKGKQQSVDHYTRIQIARRRYFYRTLGKPWIDIPL